MAQNSSYKLLTFSEVSDAMSKPGLYAWYLTMRLGKADLNTPENTTQALNKFAETMCYPPLLMNLQGHLNLQLEGELKHVHFGHANNKHNSPLLQEVLNDPKGRQTLSNIFELAVPLLCCPLYIGVSNNLKNRLNQHTKLIQTYQEEKVQREIELANIAPVDDQEDLEHDKNFAMRVVERKINPNNLIVGTIYPKENTPIVRKAVEAAETLLNRMFYPILGRR